MNALKGDVSHRAANCIAAGCDLALNCWGRMDEMIAIAGKVDAMTARATERLAAAMMTIGAPVDTLEIASLIAKRDALLQHA
jgi:beta-N-acetylhexosaminidase